tara:strand:+ start:185 stop:1108 length:924 start_codon:yes stop_codon:yes gene_type:complete
MFKFFNESDVNKQISIDDALYAVEKGFIAKSKNNIINLPRRRIDIEGSNFNLMAASWEEKGIVGFKSYVAGSKGISFHILIYSLKNNQLLSVIEANRLGQLRTGAASGIAAKYLVRNKEINLGIIGSGFQAETQLEAISKIKQINECSVFSRNKTNLNNFCKKMSKKLSIDIRSSENIKDCLSNKDIAITITNSPSPVLKIDDIDHKLCIIAAGSNFSSKSELDKSVLLKSDVVVVDDIDQAKIECGDILQFKGKKSEMIWNKTKELSKVINENKFIDSELIIFESQGVALEDLSLSFTLLEKFKII